ncbi:MAG: ureidoglycolate hydrolase [Clostridiales bacterium]|jgi:ureidoglycolate lyase|nr:ureidoglycolate hydrolase [Clostridiales bacterium]
MRKIRAQKLMREAFAPYGSYASITEPEGFHMGDFYNDKLLMPVSGALPVAFSPLVFHRAEPMPVQAAEYHNTTGEGILAMDDDVVIHVAPPSGDPVPELTEAFVVPKGTMVHLNLGMWHYGGWCLNREEVHVLIVLPQRIYKNDCTVVHYAEEEWTEIVL